MCRSALSSAIKPKISNLRGATLVEQLVADIVEAQNQSDGSDLCVYKISRLPVFRQLRASTLASRGHYITCKHSTVFSYLIPIISGVRDEGPRVQ